MNLKGRSFLKLEDYTPAEIEYLVDLAGELRQRRKQELKDTAWKERTLPLFLKSHLQEPDVHLPWEHRMKVESRHTLQVMRSS